MPEPDETPNSLRIAHAAAAQLAGEWSLDAEPVWEEEPLTEPEPVPAIPEPLAELKLGNIFPPEDAPDPPSPKKIIEAMLFVGGAPLTSADACSIIRGLTPEMFRGLIEDLSRQYRLQNRPYGVVPEGDGFVLELKPKFRSMKEIFQRGPREVRLAQPALDVLSLVAYRQPITKADLDAIAGTDSAGPLRQLSKLGLTAAVSRASQTAGAAYGTTPKFLALFGLGSLDDLPRLGDAN